jgi:hypothetical protein
MKERNVDQVLFQAEPAPFALKDAQPVNYRGQPLCACDRYRGKGKMREMKVRFENGFTEVKCRAIGARFQKPKTAIVVSTNYIRCSACKGTGVTINGGADA